MPIRILIVEDDAALAELMEKTIGLIVPEVEMVHDLTSASAALAARRPDLILADVDLPDGSGTSLIGMAKGIPVLLTSGDAQDAQVVAGLNAGAVDYLIKPFSPDVLEARVQAALRQRAKSTETEYRIGPFTFSPSEKRLSRESGNIGLTQRETDILKHLLAKGGAVDRRTLLREVWGYSDRVSTHTVETHIYRLRQKIESDPKNPRFLVTDGKGYALQSG